MIFKKAARFASPSLVRTNKYDFTIPNLFSVPKLELSYVCTKPNYTYSRPRNNWMKGIKDDTLVSMLSIPGTHDTGTYYVKCHGMFQLSGINKTQSLNIESQLQAGIRYFDLRVNKNYKINHGPFQFQDVVIVLQKIQEFLKKNPSQFVILGFQGDAMAGSLRSQIGSSALYLKEVLPVTRLRGKAWIMSGCGINFGDTFQMNGGQGGISVKDTYYLQNYWNMSNVKGCGDVDFEEKWENVKQTAFHQNVGPKKMKFNFLSGSASENNPQSAFVDGYVPYRIAWQMQGSNYRLNMALKDPANARAQLGITIMDFPGDELIGQIINTNELQS